MSEAKKIYIGYHANCPDGMAAAAVAWREFGGRAVYSALSYGEPLHETLNALLQADEYDGMGADAEVYLLDFHLTPHELNELGGRVGKLVVMDHHKTFHDACVEWEALHGPLPIERWGEGCDRAGCVLAWHYWNKNVVTPDFLLYVEDRDLWNWELLNSKVFSAAISLVPHDLQTWADLIEEFDYPAVREAMQSRGQAILAHIDKVVRGQGKAARMGFLGGVDAVIVNATAHHSELGHHLLQETPEAQVAAIYCDLEDGTRKWSLRSRPDFDCSVIAKAFGGGGHPQACGFTERRVAEFV